MINKITIVLAFIFVNSLVFAQPTTTAYCWDSPANPPNNIIPFCWIGTYPEPGKMYLISDITGITSKLQSMPMGKRCIFLWDAHRIISENSDDNLKDSITQQVSGYTDSLGFFHPYQNVWWDSGAVQVAQIHNTLFQSLSASMAPIDMVVLDYEYSISNWTLGNFVNIPPAQYDSLLTDLYQSIMSDARFPNLADSLGFSDLMCVRYWWQNDSCYLIFNDVMQKMRSTYLTTAIVNPLHLYYPDAKFSNYGDIHRSAAYTVPDINGHKHYKYGCTGTHTGTHQSSSFYGSLGQICTYNPPEGMPPFSFSFTPYNALLYETNTMKSTIMSDTVPMIGWVAFPSFQENNSCAYENSSYYFENIFHLLLSGSDDLLFWNPRYPWGPIDTIHQLQAQQVSNALIEFDSFWSSSTPDSVLFYPVDTIAPWNSPYVLTGMLSDSIFLWRFSPRLDSTYTQPASFLTSINPLTFIVHGTILTFPSGSYISTLNNISSAGIWIVAPNLSTGTIDHYGHQYQILVYPNPTSGLVHLQTNIDCNYELSLYDFTGRLLKTVNFIGQAYVLNLSGFAQGVYFLSVKNNGIISATKIIKQ